MHSQEDRRAIAEEICSALEVHSVGDRWVLELANTISTLAENSDTSPEVFGKELATMTKYLTGKGKPPAFRLIVGRCPCLQKPREASLLWPAALQYEPA